MVRYAVIDSWDQRDVDEPAPDHLLLATSRWVQFFSRPRRHVDAAGPLIPRLLSGDGFNLARSECLRLLQSIADIVRINYALDGEPNTELTRTGVWRRTV